MKSFNFSSFIINLLSESTVENPLDRINIKEIMNHTFFKLKSIFENNISVTIPEFKQKTEKKPRKFAVELSKFSNNSIAKKDPKEDSLNKLNSPKNREIIF